MKVLKKFFKIVISCLLVFIICFNHTLIYWADDSIENIIIKVLCVENTNHNVALEQIEILVRANYTKDQTVQVGDCISIYNAESDNLYYIYPVYADSKCEYIAEAGIDGSTILTDNVNKMNILNNLSEGQYILYIDNGQLYAQSESDNLLVDQEYVSDNNEKSEFYYYSYDEKVSYYEEKFGNSNICFKNMSSRNCVLQIDACTKDIETRTVIKETETGVLNRVRYKCNISNFVLQGNYSLCWAAACATIINYKTASFVTPKALADKYNIGYNQGGSTYQVKTCLNDYNLSYKVYLSKLPWEKIKENINADKPFVICMKPTQGSTAYHSITGYGYSHFTYDASASVGTIYAWDSNGSHISFLDSMTVINTAGYSYNWFGTVY